MSDLSETARAQRQCSRCEGWFPPGSGMWLLITAAEALVEGEDGEQEWVATDPDAEDSAVGTRHFFCPSCWAQVTSGGSA